MDTIFALASAAGKAGVAVVRLSGPQSWAAVARLTGELPEPRMARLRALRDASGDVLDRALVILFSEGASFTGEESAELHLHGSAAVVRAVQRELGAVPGCRLAVPGEFTRRALVNDRLDLTQVEALSDLLEAETESQRRQAMTVLSGGLGERVDVWRRDLVQAASLLEATIDFADEEVPVDVTDDVRGLLAGVLASLEEQLSGMAAAERIRAGFEVAIVGPPNAGKSTLLNVLAGREAAITSEIAGTTRDVIEVHMEIAGLAVTLLDTAGLRDSEDPIEKIGIARARERAETSDLRVFLGTPEDMGMAADNDDIVVSAKADLTGDAAGISAKTGQGIDELVQSIGQKLAERTQSAGLATRERHREAFRDGAEALTSALSLLDQGPACYDMTAEEIRTGIRRLELLIGRVDVENVLDEIFANFCLGK
ncbi:tRNA uridine-5-carboxymethylaminomethyl(34) synthesis GTPase MnmE [Salipiger mucosus]|uniref:tRNA modification GTPase MnmE n=1 Tax=Salipiger mucosus DSM 16094 TaxID=1123237 RepID=S9QST4_9RHOB|nr:tRNA uridine-5-carboxymethylaminomethyl(34) synthesis GTPase MnmE [Salipiger mucosus]EPX82652.1 GTPase and tRNA-U34 5-formylation enzyme TrmE [Salipiger mucosus DSM 16094]